MPQDARLKRLILTEEVRASTKRRCLLHQTDEFVAGLLTEEENAELLRLLNKLRKGGWNDPCKINFRRITTDDQKACHLGEYKRAAILTPIFSALEAIMDVLLPTIMAVIIDQGIERAI